MSFHLHQSGDARRRGFEVSMADLKDRASEGVSFWRGLAIGLLAGFMITYGALTGLVSRLFQ